METSTYTTTSHNVVSGIKSGRDKLGNPCIRHSNARQGKSLCGSNWARPHPAKLERTPTLGGPIPQ
eukprot:1171008-Amphidinium_carterae.1